MDVTDFQDEGMQECPVYLLTIDLLCRLVCQVDMMVLANNGLLMVLQPFLASKVVRTELARPTCL